MKKFLFLFAFAGFFAVSANAQNCQHSKANAEAEASVDQTAAEAAATAATLDETIISRTCATSGNVSYVRKVVNAETGAMTFEDVEYCTNRKGFVSLASTTTPAKSCTAKTSDKKSCAGTAAGATDAKGCCSAGATTQAGCCSGKKAATEGEAQPGKKKRGGA